MAHPFHLAINVTDLDAARRFYGGLLGAVEGRSTETWVDFDFFGHQLSLHLGTPFATEATGKVGALFASWGQGLFSPSNPDSKKVFAKLFTKDLCMDCTAVMVNTGA